jgi:hypothetical protein
MTSLASRVAVDKAPTFDRLEIPFQLRRAGFL